MKLRRLATSGASGAIATVVDMSVLVALVHAGVAVAAAAFISAGAGAVTCYLLNKHVAFRDRTPTSFAKLARFALVALATALLIAGGMELLAVELGVPYLAAKVVCSVLVFAAWSYPAQRRLVFGPAPEELPC
jgi:putative flippase GtrA